MVSENDDAGKEFVAQFLACQSRIYAFIVSLMPNRADADDVLQDTGLTLYQKYSTFEPGTDFLAWACRIAKYKVLDFGKRRGRERLRFDADTLDLVAEEYLQRGDEVQQRLQALDGCMGRLSARDRELLEECYRSARTIKAVAEAWRRPVDTIYKRLRHIRTGLYDCIQRTLAREEHS